MAQLLKIQKFFKENPHIPFFTPSSPEYPGLRQAYIDTDNPITPLGIARPKNAEDVATIVKYVVAKGVAFSVRTGGHDLFGRSFVEGGLAIDMREIAYVHVDDSKTKARVGGGTFAVSVANTLAEHGLATALGSYPTVGYVGWATHGGYGPFAANYGLGVDQVLGARVVDARGQIVDADDDMLAAIRGGGGALGVIVEVTIKCYPLRSVLAGVVIYKSDNLEKTTDDFLRHLIEMRKVGLPKELGIQQSVVNTPDGKVLVIGFMWSSEDIETGQMYLRKISSFGKPLHTQVIQTTLPEWLEVSGSFPPKRAYGAICTVRVREETDEVAAVLARYAREMPLDPGVLYSVHEVRGASARPNPDSIFSTRERHFLIECVGTSTEAGKSKAAWDWALALRDALQKTAKENIVPGSYLPLNPPHEVDTSEVYGQNWQRFKDIKTRLDPGNVFRSALPQF